MEKEMATHSSVFAWRIPGTAEPGGLPSMGSHRVKHDWRDLVVVVEGTHTTKGALQKDDVIISKISSIQWQVEDPGYLLQTEH